MILAFARRDPDPATREFLPPLTWTFGTFGPANMRFVVVICGAGHSAILSTARTMGADGRLNAPVHTIGPDGTLTPSYVCPRPECQFHRFVRLDGWTGEDGTAA